MQADFSLSIRHLAGSPSASRREQGVFLLHIFTGLLLLICLVIEKMWGMPVWLAALPFAASLFICGMPHGAMDWHVHRRNTGGGSVGYALIRFVPYTLLCVLCALALFAVPVGYIAFFLVLSMLHFGRSDARARAGWPSASIAETARGISRAAAIVALPFAFQPMATGEAIAQVSALASGPSVLPLGFTAVFGVLGAIGIAVWLLDAAFNHGDESIMCRLLPLAVVATSAFLPPLFSVGVWFLLWHALRECIVLDEQPERMVRAAARTHLRSLPLMIPTLVLVVVIVGIADISNPVLSVAVATLVLYAVFTPAHHLLQELVSSKPAQPGTGAGYSVGAPGPTGSPSTNTQR